MLAPARRQLELANVSVVLGTMAAVAALVPVGPLAQCASVLGLIVLVGAVVASRLDLSTASLTQRLSICLGFGFLSFLVVTAVIGAVFPHLGVSRPLSRWPLVVSWCVLDAIIVGWLARSGSDPVRSALSGCRARDAAWAVVLGVPPLLALVGMALVNASRGVELADVVGGLAVAMALAAVVLPTASWTPPRILLLASALLTATWQGTFRGGWLAGYDVQHEFYIGTLAINQAQFPLQHYVDPYGGMLSLTVWPAALHALTGITLRTTLGLVPSVFLALALLVTWSALRDRLQPRLAAALCALFVVGSSPLLQQLPEVTRQCYALFFFSLLVLAIVPGRLAPRTARAVAIASGVGLALTHYSTAYLAAGAVIVGCALCSIARAPRETRILTLPVSGVIVGAAALWGGIVAKTGSSIGQIASSIRSDGFQLLPGTGGILSRWLTGASVSQLVNSKVIYNADLNLLEGRYRWMKVIVQSQELQLVNDPAPTSHGAPVIGRALSAGSTGVSQLLLLCAVLGTLFLVWRCIRRERALGALAGVALFFVGAAGLSRFSQTIGVDFGPSRVEAQAYLAFVVVVCVVLATDPVADRMRKVLATVRRQRLALGVTALAVVAAVMTSTGLAALVEVHQQLPDAYSTTGEQAQRLLTPADLQAAKWVATNRPKQLVQADRIGMLALDDYGFNDRPNFFSTVDPIIVDNSSWIYAYRTNVVLGTARGGNNARTGVFKFPAPFFSSWRSTLYASGTDLVYGSIPYDLSKGDN